MMEDEHCEDCDQEDGGHMHHMDWPMKREFKIAMMEKKEKILQAKLEFIGKMKEMIKKMPDEKK